MPASQSRTDGRTARVFSCRLVLISPSSVYLAAGDAEVAEELGVTLPLGASRGGTGQAQSFRAVCKQYTTALRRLVCVESQVDRLCTTDSVVKSLEG